METDITMTFNQRTNMLAMIALVCRGEKGSITVENDYYKHVFYTCSNTLEAAGIGHTGSLTNHFIDIDQGGIIHFKTT